MLDIEERKQMKEQDKLDMNVIGTDFRIAQLELEAERLFQLVTDLLSQYREKINNDPVLSDFKERIKENRDKISKLKESILIESRQAGQLLLNLDGREKN